MNIDTKLLKILLGNFWLFFKNTTMPLFIGFSISVAITPFNLQLTLVGFILLVAATIRGYQFWQRSMLIKNGQIAELEHMLRVQQLRR